MMPTLALVIFGVMFLVVFVARSVIQKRRTGDTGVRAGVLGAAPGSVEWLAGWMLVAALLTPVAAPVAELAGLAPWTDATWVRSVGAGIAVVATGLTFLAQLNMGDEWRIGVDESEQTDLVTTGVFGFVRNPIFSALILAAAGLAVMVPNPISAVGVVLLIAAIEMQVRSVEEPHLRRLHGDSYADYEARVGRLVPRFGRTTRPGRQH